MQAARALFEPVQGLLYGVGVKGGDAVHVALLQAYALSVFEVDGRNQQHGGFRKVKTKG